MKPCLTAALSASLADVVLKNNKNYVKVKASHLFIGASIGDKTCLA